MEDKQELTVEKYAFQVKNRYRARGAIILETSEGLCLMREYEKIREHFAFENEIKEQLMEKGMPLTDRVVPNCQGELVTEWESGEKYVVYRWYKGRSCDYRENNDLALAAENLGRLHKNLSGMSSRTSAPEEFLPERYRRRCIEMKRIYQYMKKKKRKNEFELYAMSCFREFYQKAEIAGNELADSSYLKRIGQEPGAVCHGEYNYHNLIFTTKGVATTNFERAASGIQLLDLAYFLRKVMEKNQWQEEKGEVLLSAYRNEMPLEADALEFLKTVLSFPIKYWKLMNQYMNGKKSWMSDKNMTKLTEVREMESAKNNFLKNMERI